MIRTLKTGIVLGAAIAIVMVSAEAGAQATMVDYESSAKAAQIRDSAAWRLAFRPALSVLQQTVSQLRSAPGLAPTMLRDVDELIAKAAMQPEADARRTLWQAVTLLNGVAWTPEQELLGALALKTPAPIWTGTRDQLTIEALYATRAAGSAGYSVNLFSSEPTSSATPKKGKLVRVLAHGKLAGKYPQSVPTNLNGVPDGSYLLLGEVKTASGAITQVAQPVYVVRQLQKRYEDFNADFGRIQGHNEARWIAEYPYALAQAINAGNREVISYDFPQAFERSRQILASLKAGQDPVRQAKGLQNRAYLFEETGELIPYQIYVPGTWSSGKQWPLVVALHGANLDETNMLMRDGGRMQQLAEEHGFIVVSPLGYRLNSAYGSERGFSESIVGKQFERRARSEKDVLRVTELVEQEYNIDARRRYLTGNSMGGGGTWWIGGRHADRWAAIAPAAYGGVLPEDVPNLARVPILAVVGDRDEVGMLERVRASLATLHAGGVSPEYIEVPGGTHAGAFETALPRIFQFFDKHAK